MKSIVCKHQSSALGSPLSIACYAGNTAAARHLLDVGESFGLDVDERNLVTGNTLAHDAVRGDNVDILDLLLKRGARRSIRNKQEETPLHFATRLNRLECVRLLLFEKKKQRKRGEQKQGQEEEGGEKDEEEEKETEEEWAKTKGKDKSKKRDTLISLTRQQEKRERFVVNQRKQLLSAKNHRGRTPQNIADMVGVHEVVLGGGLGSTLRMGKGSVLTERIGLGLGPATSTTRVRPTSAVIRARNSGMLDILQPSQRKVTSKRTGERREGGGGGGGGRPGTAPAGQRRVGPTTLPKAPQNQSPPRPSTATAGRRAAAAASRPKTARWNV